MSGQVGDNQERQLGWTEGICAGRGHFDEVSWPQIVGKSQR